MIKLYSFMNSICTQKVFITLAEKKQPYDIQLINLFKNEQFSPEYLKIHPKGVVPALDHDGRVVIESSLICEYLDDAFPEPPLVPADPWAKARMRLWSKMVDEHLFEATRELSFSAMFRERMKNMTDEQREGRFKNTGDPIKRARLESTYAEGVDSPYVYQGIGEFEIAFSKMEKDLAGGSGWLVGDRMTLADINMMPFVARLAYLDLLDVWIRDRPATQDWWARSRELGSFKVSISDQLKDAEIEEMKTFGSRIRDRVEAHREHYLRQPRFAA
ncbi:MAG: glutathione S-transferase family protein [Hyphomicrobiales bacterium]|nr:glutathione S-transferase family protein [Hyphomicrobiales bacterium]